MTKLALIGAAVAALLFVLSRIDAMRELARRITHGLIFVGFIAMVIFFGSILLKACGATGSDLLDSLDTIERFDTW